MFGLTYVQVVEYFHDLGLRDQHTCAVTSLKMVIDVHIVTHDDFRRDFGSLGSIRNLNLIILYLPIYQ